MMSYCVHTDIVTKKNRQIGNWTQPYINAKSIILIFGDETEMRKRQFDATKCMHFVSEHNAWCGLLMNDVLIRVVRQV